MYTARAVDLLFTKYSQHRNQHIRLSSSGPTWTPYQQQAKQVLLTFLFLQRYSITKFENRAIFSLDKGVSIFFNNGFWVCKPNQVLFSPDCSYTICQKYFWTRVILHFLTQSNIFVRHTKHSSSERLVTVCIQYSSLKSREIAKNI